MSEPQKPADWPKWVSFGERDWPDTGENSCYFHLCKNCGKPFHGHKRRPTLCRKCSSVNPQPGTADDMVPKAIGDELIRLRAEVHGWRLINSEPDKVVEELNRLRAEVEQWKTTAAKDREENVDMRNEIADLRAQLAALEASERKAHYEREDARQSLELCRTELASAQEDKERWKTLVTKAQAILTDNLVPDGISNSECINRLLNLLDGPEYRAAIDAARKETKP